MAQVQPRKPIKSQEQKADLAFPFGGIDLSHGFAKQMPHALADGSYGGTTPVGQNVRAFEAGTARMRGGQRPGLAKYVLGQVNGTQLIQDLNSVVSVSSAAVAGTQPIVVGTQAGSTGLTGPGTCTATLTVLAGSAIVVTATPVDAAGTVAISGITDTQGNAYSQVQAATNGNYNAFLWYAPNAVGGAVTITATFTGGASSVNGFKAVEVQGVLSSPLDTSSKNTGSSTTATAGAITTANGIEVLIGVVQGSGSGAITSPTGFTNMSHSTVTSGSSDYEIVNTVQTALNVTWTVPNGTWAACVAAFKGGIATTQTNQSGRIVSLVAVSGGTVKVLQAGGLAWGATVNGTAAMATTGIVRSTSCVQKLWMVDGVNAKVYDPATNAVTSYVASAGVFPVDIGGNLPRLICTWQGAVMLSGLLLDGQNWFRSAIGDPTNFNYTPLPTGVIATQAICGNNAPFGKVGDNVTTLIPYTDDLLVCGCDHSIWLFQGNPTAGGTINQVSPTIGMAWGQPWCIGPDGTLYFVSNQMGVYTMVPGQGAPVRMSQPIEQLLTNVNSGLSSIRLLWDNLWQGLHIFVTTIASAQPAAHLFWEQRTGAWWQDVFPSNNFNPLCCTTFDGNLTSDRRSLIGSWDGYVRSFSPLSQTDDGLPIQSQVFLGPLLTKDLDDVMIKDLIAVLGEQSGNVGYAVYIGRTAERALGSSAVSTGTWGSSRSYNTPIRRAAHALYVKLTATNYWAMEAVSARVEAQGFVRQRRR